MEAGKEKHKENRDGGGGTEKRGKRRQRRHSEWEPGEEKNNTPRVGLKVFWVGQENSCNQPGAGRRTRR